jgi:hypothetical protein
MYFSEFSSYFSNFFFCFTNSDFQEKNRWKKSFLAIWLSRAGGLAAGEARPAAHIGGLAMHTGGPAGAAVRERESTRPGRNLGLGRRSGPRAGGCFQAHPVPLDQIQRSGMLELL